MKNKSIIFFFIFSLFGIIFLFPALAEAQSKSLTKQVEEQMVSGADKAGLGKPTNLQMEIVGIIQVILFTTGMVFLALVVYGGFVYVNSRGEEEQVKKAQKIITASIIGLAIILLSYSVTLFIGGI